MTHDGVILGAQMARITLEAQRGNQVASALLVSLSDGPTELIVDRGVSDSLEAAEGPASSLVHNDGGQALHTSGLGGHQVQS